MTVELSGIVPRIFFALFVGFVFFIILRSELSYGKRDLDSSNNVSGDNQPDNNAIYRTKRLTVNDTAENETNVRVFALVFSQNVSQIRQELADTRVETDFLYWLFTGTALFMTSAILFGAIYCLIDMGFFSHCHLPRRPRIYREKWWESKEEDYDSYFTFASQKIRLDAQMEPIDGDTVATPKLIPKKLKRGIDYRRLATIKESNNEMSDKMVKPLVTYEYSVDLTPGFKTQYISPNGNDVLVQKHCEPTLVSVIYAAPDFLKNGLPVITVPAIKNYH